jgi:hypothetical protein
MPRPETRGGAKVGCPAGRLWRRRSRDPRVISLAVQHDGRPACRLQITQPVHVHAIASGMAKASTARSAHFLRPTWHGSVRPHHTGRTADPGAMGRQHYRGVGRSRKSRSRPAREHRRVSAGGAVRSYTSISRTALVVLEGYADAKVERPDGLKQEEFIATAAACGGRENSNMCSIRICRGTRKFGQHGLGWNAGSKPSDPCSHDASRQQPRRAAVLPTIRIPTLVMHHAHDVVFLPTWGRTSPITYLAQSTPNSRGATLSTSLNRGASRSSRSPSSSQASRLRWPTIGFSPQCSSPTSLTRRVGQPKSATETGMPCSTRMSRCAVAARPVSRS